MARPPFAMTDTSDVLVLMVIIVALSLILLGPAAIEWLVG